MDTNQESLEERGLTEEDSVGGLTRTHSRESRLEEQRGLTEEGLVENSRTYSRESGGERAH